MALRLLITLILGCISFYGYTASKSPIWEELFPFIQEFPKCEEKLNHIEKNALPWEVVSQYLLQIKNKVEYNNGLKNKYHAIGRIIYKSNIYLLYDMTDGYEYEVYMCVYSAEKSYPLTLIIYRSISGECEIDFSINNGRITLHNHINNVENPYVKDYIYELNANFSQIRPVEDSCNNDELEIISPIIVKYK